MTEIKACLFDFNGTMFFDGRLHDKAWRETISKEIGKTITDEDIRKYIYGCNNRDIVKHFFLDKYGWDKLDSAQAEGENNKTKSTKTDEEIDNIIFQQIDKEITTLAKEIAEKKESLYRTLCRELDTIELAPGLADYLDRLKADGIKCAIVSAATKENIELYFEVFNLNKWFSWEQIVYDDGILPGKPAPDMWLAAADRLHVDIGNCIVYEDSLNGILAAKRAGAARIVAVYGDADRNMLEKQGLADEYVHDWTKE